MEKYNCGSAYMRIKGIRDGDLKITLKQGQNIWPEWSVTDAAADVQGEHFVFVGDAWQKVNAQAT